MAAGFESNVFQFLVLFVAVIVVGLWGLWDILAPISNLRFIFNGMYDNDKALSSLILFFYMRMKGIVTLETAVVFWLGLRRGNNRITTLLLVVMLLGTLASAGLFIYAIRNIFPTTATFGTVLPLAIWFGAALIALVFLIRHITSSASSSAPSAKWDIFAIYFIVIAPLFFLAFGIWELVSPKSIAQFFFPAFDASPVTDFVFDSAINQLVIRFYGIMTIICVLVGVLALFGADSRTTAQVLITYAVGISAHIIAYADLYAIAPWTTAGPILFFVGLGLYVLIALYFIYSFYFNGYKRESIKHSDALYSVGTPFEYA